MTYKSTIDSFTIPLHLRHSVHCTAMMHAAKSGHCESSWLQINGMNVACASHEYAVGTGVRLWLQINGTNVACACHEYAVGTGVRL